jgi:hypothetical protein
MRYYIIILVVAGMAAALVLSGCSSRPTCAEHQGDPPVANLGKKINSPEDDYAPFIDKSGLFYFTSDRGTEDAEYKDDRLRYGEDIFRSVRTADGWGVGAMAQPPLTTDLNEGTISIADNGDAVLARAHDAGGVHFGGSDLYGTFIGNYGAIDLHNLGAAVNSGYWDAQPALIADGSLLVFSSDRPGGLGKTDLWYCTKEADGSWSQAKNLGPRVNTSGNEYSPSVSHYGKELALFYASDGIPGGTGGLDMYYVIKADQDWGTPVNVSTIGPDVNTSSNDAYPFLTRGQDTLYFASDRPGGCGGYDLFAATIDLPKQFLRGVVRDSTNGKPLRDTATVTITSMGTNAVVAVRQTLPPGSEFDFALRPGEYRLTVESRGYYASTPVDTAVSTARTTKCDLHLVPVLIPNTTIAQVDLRSAEIPFFVTGYYRLNVPANLEGLRSMLSGQLQKADYISRDEANDPQYAEFAKQVQTLIADSIIDPVKRVALSRFRPSGNEWLEIEITGYADPRDLYYDAKYLEDAIRFKTPTGQLVIKKNDRMDNMTLSNLRAYHAKEYLHQVLAESVPGFAGWYEKGRIVYRIHGAGVDKSELSYPARRRVRVEVRARNK